MADRGQRCQAAGAIAQALITVQLGDDDLCGFVRSTAHLRAMAKAINAKTVEIASSHVAMLARPEETANLILEAAGRAAPSNVGLKSAQPAQL
jgi:hypothetical protein